MTATSLFTIPRTQEESLTALAKLAVLLEHFDASPERECICCREHQHDGAQIASDLKEGLRALNLHVAVEIEEVMCYQPIPDLLVPLFIEVLGLDADRYRSYRRSDNVCELTCTKTPETSSETLDKAVAAFKAEGLMLGFELFTPLAN